MGLDDMFLDLLFNGNDQIDGTDLSRQTHEYFESENINSSEPFNPFVLNLLHDSSTHQEPFNFIEPIEDIIDETQLPDQAKYTSGSENASQEIPFMNSTHRPLISASQSHQALEPLFLPIEPSSEPVQHLETRDLEAVKKLRYSPPLALLNIELVERRNRD